jgi:hypothetical protein
LQAQQGLPKCNNSMGSSCHHNDAIPPASFFGHGHTRRPACLFGFCDRLSVLVLGRESAITETERLGKKER